MYARKKTHVVAIGQVPPPVTGQAVMIRMMVDAIYPEIEITHIPMVLSQEVSSMGRFAVGKLVRLVRVPFQTILARFRSGARVLYYPPSGPVKLAVYRDIFVLLLTRPFFARTVFHFHAGGLSEIYPALPRPIQWLYRKALLRPDVIVRISPSSPSEIGPLKGFREVLVPNGIPDPAGYAIDHTAMPGTPMRILFVGHLVEGKGILILLEAFAALVRKGFSVQLTCIGKWGSDEDRIRAEKLIREHRLEEHVSLPGGLFGEAKWNCFRQAHLFCFPSFFHSEVFPLVLLEAMAFSLPIVATRWRGIPDLVEEGENALLIPTQDASACAEGLSTLIADPVLRTRFGTASRARFLAGFTADVHLASMERVLLTAARS